MLTGAVCVVRAQREAAGSGRAVRRSARRPEHRRGCGPAIGRPIVAPVARRVLTFVTLSPRAAELMTRTTSVVTLEVAKQGAIYHGLATLLSQPSPTMQRRKDGACPSMTTASYGSRGDHAPVGVWYVQGLP